MYELNKFISHGVYERINEDKVKEDFERIAKVGFEAAQKRRKKLTLVDKANVLETSRLWRDTVTKMASSYPDVELDFLFVDNAAMQMILAPTQFDVILTENMFGDIISDEGSVIGGSIGLLPSASVGAKVGLYEPIHGSAPDIAGKGIANPIATILSFAMALRYSLDLDKEAEALEKAVQDVLNDGLRTKDILSDGMKEVSTSQMGDAIISKLQ